MRAPQHRIAAACALLLFAAPAHAQDGGAQPADPAALPEAAAHPAPAGTAPTVAVLDLNAFSVSLEDASAMGAGIAAMLTSELAARPGVRIVDRQRIEEVLRRQSVSVGMGGVSDDVALQVGRMLGANYIVTGSVALDSRNARIDLRLLDVETSAIHRTAKQSGERDELLSLVEQVADEFTRDLTIPERAPVLDVDVPARAALAYSRGLDYEQRGRSDDAATMYRRVLELFPAHPHAAGALDRVNGS